MFRRLFAALIAFLLYGVEPSDPDALADDAGETEEGKDSRLVESQFARSSLVESEQSHAASDFAAAKPPARVAGSLQDYVGVVTLTAMPGAVATEDALVSALSACRDRCDLKIQVIAGSCDAEFIRRTCERHGFMFSKLRQAGSGLVMEFYTDLYYRSPSGGRGLGSRRGS